MLVIILLLLLLHLFLLLLLLLLPLLLLLFLSPSATPPPPLPYSRSVSRRFQVLLQRYASVVVLKTLGPGFAELGSLSPNPDVFGKDTLSQDYSSGARAVIYFIFYFLLKHVTVDSNGPAAASWIHFWV